VSCASTSQAGTSAATARADTAHIMAWSVNSDGPQFRAILTGAVGDYGTTAFAASMTFLRGTAASVVLIMPVAYSPVTARARVLRVQAQDHPHRGRLPGPVRADEPGDLPGPDGE
jgi:hypothetical protein